MKKFISKFNLTILTMIETIKVSSKGQVVIPEKLRNLLEIKEGTKLVLRDNGKEIILEKEDDFLNKIKYLEATKEKTGLMALAEENLSKIWNNKKDEEEWSKYLWMNLKKKFT